MLTAQKTALRVPFLFLGFALIHCIGQELVNEKRFNVSEVLLNRIRTTPSDGNGRRPLGTLWCAITKARHW